MLKDLIKLANDLDKQNNYKIAAKIDGIIKKAHSGEEKHQLARTKANEAADALSATLDRNDSQSEDAVIRTWQNTYDEEMMRLQQADDSQAEESFDTNEIGDKVREDWKWLKRDLMSAYDDVIQMGAPQTREEAKRYKKLADRCEEMVTRIKGANMDSGNLYELTFAFLGVFVEYLKKDDQDRERFMTEPKNAEGYMEDVPGLLDEVTQSMEAL